MSSFLETNTEPGQKTLSGFLKMDSADDVAARSAQPDDAGARSAPAQQTRLELGRETREQLAKQMHEHRLQREAGCQTAEAAGASHQAQLGAPIV